MAELAARTSAKRTRAIFGADTIEPAAAPPELDALRVSTRIRQEYGEVRELPPALAAKMATAAVTAAEKRRKIKNANAEEQASDPKMRKMIEASSERAEKAKESMALTVRAGKGPAPNAHGPTPMRDTPSTALVRKDTVRQVRPDWHAPWKVMRVISGHMGWVRSVAVEPDNQWFASGSADRTIKIWDLASGTLKLTLTGHISAVRGLAVSPRHPYLFSCGEDKMIKCR